MHIGRVTNDKLLFTPGPLTTSRTVKEAMLRDLGSRDGKFVAIVRRIRRSLVELAGGAAGYTAIPMQGSGTFGIEAVLASAMPPDKKLLVVANGAYGRRIAQIAGVLKIPTETLSFAESDRPDVQRIAQALESEPAIAMLAVVHCETSTGMFNPIAELGDVARRFDRRFFVDAMSSFGAVPIDAAKLGIDYLVSSANKCIEGVPGFSFVVARLEALLATEGWARSVSLDLLAQYRGLEATGQFRFTPPTHAMLAFDRALDELAAEGGVAGRADRYRANYETLIAGMRKLGFEEYLTPELQGYIITAFRYPADSSFSFERFYNQLADQGFVIYPGKVTDADCFRIGTIGRIHPGDVRGLLDAIESTMSDE